MNVFLPCFKILFDVGSENCPDIDWSEVRLFAEEKIVLVSLLEIAEKSKNFFKFVGPMMTCRRFASSYLRDRKVQLTIMLQEASYLG